MWRVLASKSAASLIKYHDEGLARDDYYRENGRVQSNWLGKGAGQLALAGSVQRDDFVAVVNNRDPNTGERLTLRDKSNRRPAYEVTVTAWKSASVMSEIYGCDDIRDAFERVSDEVMVESAEPEMRTRVRTKGADFDRITGNAIIAGFPHANSRPQDGWSDAHLHKHYIIANATWDEVEKRRKAAQLGVLKEKAPCFELEHDYRLARELMRLGYVPTMGKHGVQLKGVPQSVIDKNSRSSIRNEKEALELGITDAEGKRKLSDRLRKSKKGDLSPDALLEKRLGELTDSEKAALEKVKNKEIKPGPAITSREARDFAIDHLFQRRDDITENKLRKTMVHYGIGYVSPKQADAEIANAIKGGVIHALDTKNGRVFVKSTTLRDQTHMTRLSRQGIGKYEPLTQAYENHPELSREQNNVARIISESRDKYLGFRGPAGTGKSYTLKGVDAVIRERKGRSEKHFSSALALAPSASASRGELRKAGFRDADTLAAFFANEKKQEEMRGQFLIVDEAGMMSTKDMVELMNIAEKYDNRVLFVGDWKQLPSVDAGDAFRLLQAEGGLKYAELTENRRQKNAEHREAVDAISTGTEAGIKRGLKQLDRLGAMVVEPDAEKLRMRLTQAFLKASDEGKTGLIVSPTLAEGDLLTDKLREALKERGKITGPEHLVPMRRATNWTDAERRDARNYEPGMIVEFHEAVPGQRKRKMGKRETVGGFARGETAVVTDNGLLMRTDGSTAPLPKSYAERFEVYRPGWQKLGKGDQIRITKNGKVRVDGQAVGTRVNNGDIYPIEGFTKEGDFRLPGGKILPKNYGHIAFGYVSTVRPTQGRSVDVAFHDMSNEALKAVGRREGYVLASRFKEDMMFFGNSKEAISQAMLRGGDRKTAFELVKEHLGEERITVRPRFSVLHHIRHNRMVGFFKDRVQAIRETSRNLKEGWRRREALQHG